MENHRILPYTQFGPLLIPIRRCPSATSPADASICRRHGMSTVSQSRRAYHRRTGIPCRGSSSVGDQKSSSHRIHRHIAAADLRASVAKRRSSPIPTFEGLVPNLARCLGRLLDLR
jgi:hypothetical protein